ncbi:MAG: hypothetical protein ACK8QZ_08195, partial [Anaerolineales bacterium]
AVSAAGLELAAVAVGLSASSRNQAIRQAGAVMGGGMKLMGGVLASGAAMVGVVFDFKDMVGELSAKRHSTSLVYFLRSTAQVGSAYFAAAIGLAMAGRFIEHLIQRYGEKRSLTFILDESAKLALKMAFMLRWCIRINVVIFASTVVLEILLPNALQNYLQHCTFRRDRSIGTPINEEQELKNLHKAIESTL